MKRTSFIVGVLAAGLLLHKTLQASHPDLIPPAPAKTLVRTIRVNEDGAHNVGRSGGRGWEVDYKRDRPGYVLARLHDPLLLEPGLYRATFTLRRGHYPNKGLLFKTYGLFRLEIWDVTSNEPINQRELQIGDLGHPNSYEPRWLEFSMTGREGHLIEPRIYWIGLANGETASVQIERFPEVPLCELEEKALRMGQQLERNHIENGFVVSRQLDGTADETGDATTYTGFYVASLAWKYASTHDEHTYQALENGLATLHGAIKGTTEEPLLTRFVDENGTPFPKSPSKDVYTSFFLAYSAAYPHIASEALRKQMRGDVEHLAKKFLRDGLELKAGATSLTSLTPHITNDEVRDGIRQLLADKKDLRKIIKAFKTSRKILPFGELWPGMVQVIRALEKQDENKLFELVPSVLDGACRLVERVRDILREQYRQDLFPKRYANIEYPGIHLADMLTSFLKKFPKGDDGKRIRKLSDMRILASNALISLHIVKTAAALTGQSTFKDYYRANLYTQDELLKTALDWYGIEDDLLRLVAGNPTADSERRGYLGTMALLNLTALEENPAVKEKYRLILEKEWSLNKLEANPLIATLHANGAMDAVRRDLSLYSEQRIGFGPAFWRENGKEIADNFGGGEENGFSREALPISHRPKDSFLWQRNARRLSGDSVKIYPATDYLFVYWYARYHKLIPDTPPEPMVKH